MNADMLKELYKRICGDYHQLDRGWYDNYKKITTDVQHWRDEHNGTELLSSTEDMELLRRMLYDDSNGVSDHGQSTFSMVTFEGLILDGDFLHAATDFVRTSNQDNFDRLMTAVRSYVVDNKGGKSMPKLRVYRFAAACDTELSTVVNEGTFNGIFWGLINDGLLDRPDDDICKGNWYRKNRWLTEQLKTAIPDNAAEGDEVDCYWRNMFVWFLGVRYFNAVFQNKPQVVKYGPPGTGKTYLSRREMRFCFTAWQIANAIPTTERFEDHYLQLQFHPSFGYEDFLEGMRPVEVSGKGEAADGKEMFGESGSRTELRLKNGQFKELCKKAGRWEIDLIEEDVFPDGNPEKSYLSCKVSELAALAKYKEKLLAKVDVSGDHYWKQVFETPQQEKTLEEVLPPYFVLIDEINRAELSRTFGELMFCLEYRGVRGAVGTQYSELNTKDDAMIVLGGAAKFFVPTNVRIIGTMNTIDRSVESFDFALRRRFGWEYVGPDEFVLKNYLNENMSWLSAEDRNELVNGWKSLNKMICDDPLLGRDYQIGHAYLMNLKYAPESLERKLLRLREVLWSDAISPLLEEYLRGTYDRDDSKPNDPIEKFRKAFGL